MRLSPHAARQELVTSSVQSGVALQQRSIAWLATSTFSTSSWGPGDLEGSGLLLGSVATQLLHLVDLPVTLVK